MKIPKHRKAAEGQPCIRCGADDGTVCLRHYEGFRKKEFGKGMGIKGHDFAAADLCMRCDQELSVMPSRDQPFSVQHKARLEHSEEWFYLCMLTMIRRYEQGVIR